MCFVVVLVCGGDVGDGVQCFVGYDCGDFFDFVVVGQVEQCCEVVVFQIGFGECVDVGVSDVEWKVEVGFVGEYEDIVEQVVDGGWIDIGLVRGLCVVVFLILIGEECVVGWMFYV